MHSHCPDSALSLCRDDNSSVSFSVEVPIPGDGSVLLCHCPQGRHPVLNNNCARLSGSLPAVQMTDFLKAAAFAPANSGWKAAHTPQQQPCLRYSGATNPLYQRPAHRGTAVLSGGDLRSGSLAAFNLFHVFNNRIFQNHFIKIL